MELPDWTRGMVLLGQDIAGDLQVVGLDDAGRISAFIIDSRDAWDRLIAVGNAELAVRMGSVVRYDRRGSVIWLEDFDRGRRLWTFDTDGAAAGADLDPTSSRSGGYSLRLHGGTTPGAYAKVFMTRPTVPVGRIGLEFAFAFKSAVNYMCAYLVLADGSHSYRSGIRYVFANKKVQIRNAAGGWTDAFTASYAGIGSINYNMLKLVVDQDAKKYERVLFNDVEEDLSAYGYEDEGASGDSWVVAELVVYSVGGRDDTIQFDDVIMTVAEPAN